MKKSTRLHAYTLQNFAGRHFFDVNDTSIVYSWEIDTETEDIVFEKVSLQKLYKKTLEKFYNGL